MNLSFKLFFVLSTVLSTVSVAFKTEPCLPSPDHGNDDSPVDDDQVGANNGYGKYDMPACDFCAHSGKGHGQCCNAIFTHSCGRDDDWPVNQQPGSNEGCNDLNAGCKVGQGDCYPGLICVSKKCNLPTDNPEAHAATSALVTSSSKGTIVKGGPSFVLVVVGLLGVAMMALQVALQRRHRGAGLLRRHHYSEVEATATRIDV